MMASLKVTLKKIPFVVAAWNSRKNLTRLKQDVSLASKNLLSLFLNKLRGRSPVPKTELIHLVTGTEDVAWFLKSGALAAESIREISAKNGIDLNRCEAILDFGCGAGRVIR